MAPPADTAPIARRIHVRGVVQGVGFRPFVYRLAAAHALHGWVLNGDDGVRIHVEGVPGAIAAFLDELRRRPPPAADISGIDIAPGTVESLPSFEIRDSAATHRPTTRMAPDLPVCEACLRELFDPADRRHGYPYINCTDCGPRYSIVRSLPYDRPRTTMAAWPMCEACAAEYADPANRRFHAQPVACPACGPGYVLTGPDGIAGDGGDPIAGAAARLRDGAILAVKGIGGFHLACDADNAAAVAALRERKYRKEQAFAVMVRDAAVAARTVALGPEASRLLASPARPIVLAPALAPLPGVAPDNRDLGVMLPYAPLHHLLFAAGAPARLVMTSGNRSSEPTVFDDEDARRRLGGLADAFLVGARPIARRVDDSVVRVGALGPVVLRRSRGLAPGAAAMLPVDRPILAVGGDLKNTITLVVGGQAYVSQHVGDLGEGASRQAFADTVRDLLDMYEVAASDLTVVHDRHPQYASTALAAATEAADRVAVQHHRAHVASVLAEQGAFERRVIGVALDGTGYGDDGGIWGGEIFAGSLRAGFERVAHLQPARLPGGDAAARHPVQAAAGYVAELGGVPDLTAPPFGFPDRYRQAAALVTSGVRTFPTTSTGRLFDTVAALAGFVRPITFEGQAAMWLEQLARQGDDSGMRLPTLALHGALLDWRDTLAGIVARRAAGAAPADLARAFHRVLAAGLAGAVVALARAAGIDTLVLSGGVMQNALLVEDLLRALSATTLRIWVNHAVPPNDGGLSLGQAAMAAAAT